MITESRQVDIVVDPYLWLQSEHALSLDAWYATPLTQKQAMELQTLARQQLQQQMTRANSSAAPRLADLIAGFWLGRDVSYDYRSLVATLPGAERAQLELVYGQLLMSCKRSGAMEHLARGFEFATTMLAPAAYFILLRRHTLLRHLVLTPAGSVPQHLSDLLLEARVIQQLNAGRGTPGERKNSHDDTLG